MSESIHVDFGIAQTAYDFLKTAFFGK